MKSTYKVWSLDVLGHGSDECCEAYNCPCVIGEHSHNLDGCDSEFQVNDRCEVGKIVCEKVQKTSGYVLWSEVEDTVTLGDLEFEGDDEHIYLNDSRNGRPIFQLELDSEE